MREIGDRIRERRIERHLSVPALAKRCGVSKQAAYDWERGDSVPSGPNLVALAKELATTEKWLNNEEPPKDVSQKRQIGVTPPAERGNIVTLDELDIRIAAGTGSIVDGNSKVAEWAVPQGLVRVATNSLPESIIVLTIVGDSMPASFRPFDKVMVDTTDRNPQPPGIFVVWEGKGMVVKRVMGVPHSDPPLVRIMSENPAYDTYELPLEQAHIQGRVLGKWQWI